MNEDYQLAYLIDHPHFLADVVKLNVESFRQFYPNTTEAAVTEKFKAHLNRNALPICFILIKNQKLIATTCLRKFDFPKTNTPTYWSEGTIVHPEYRNQGIATLLLQKVMQEAKKIYDGYWFGYTAILEKLLTRLGWETLEEMDYNGVPGVVMRIDVRAI